ncbi:hypothetical protein CUT44_16015 [Streptomyces carminius]|uniref:Secreted protein n=1 Tax=Streptomyces carminius TaxID=2665496 RepID=A0A2M8LY01_9ACTN|nr:hypothetical protein [Streptomyces carminius]PJE96820.1 hypothetical protein CUT44_16015 [Streptomyces carminius]
MRTGKLTAAVPAVATALIVAPAAVTGTAHATGPEDPLLPHPGPGVLRWIPERFGDGGAVSGGMSADRPTTVTVACQGGGEVLVTMEPDSAEAPAEFRAECPAGTPGTGSTVIPPGPERGFTVGVDASDQSVRWSLTVTVPDP